MDPLTGLLQGPRARDAFVLKMVMEPPWSVLVQDRAPLTIAAVVEGSAWVVTDDGDRHHIDSGQIAILPGPLPYRLADRPETKPQIIVHPGQRCEDTQGRSLEEPYMRAVRTWGNDPNGSTVMVVGTYEQVGETAARVLQALPPLAIVESTDVDQPIVDLIAAEVARDALGQAAVLDRLLDLLTVATLRSWFESRGSDAPSWWRASGDPVIGSALALLQHNPAHPWTVATLASETGVSRALLARRFTELVGQPPMSFLTDSRLALASDLLLEPDATVQGVAAKVGYSTGFALSAAFKRTYGQSPTEHRRVALSAP